jgi:micrococcal nuclease
MDPVNLWHYRATVVRVVDGDTVDVSIDLGFHITTVLRLRLSGINAPEVHGVTAAAGHAATAALSAMVLEAHLTIVTEKDRTEKYGRYLATLLLDDGTNVNEALVASGHAVPYDGGPRASV